MEQPSSSRTITQVVEPATVTQVRESEIEWILCGTFSLEIFWKNLNVRTNIWGGKCCALAGPWSFVEGIVVK